MKKIALILLCFIIGCSGPGDIKSAKLMSESSIKHIDLKYHISDDPLNGENARGYVFYIENNEGFVLTSCRLVINDLFTAELKNIKTTTFLSTKKLSAGNVQPRQKIEIIFSHDVDNFKLFQKEKGIALHPDIIPTSLKLICSEGEAKWDLQEK